jgi:hypothetical protein
MSSHEDLTREKSTMAGTMERNEVRRLTERIEGWLTDYEGDQFNWLLKRVHGLSSSLMMHK